MLQSFHQWSKQNSSQTNTSLKAHAGSPSCPSLVNSYTLKYWDHQNTGQTRKTKTQLPSKPMNNSKVDKMALLTIGTSDWHLLIFPLPPLGTAICWSCFHTWYDFTFLRKLEPCRRNPPPVPTLLHLALCQGSPMSSYKCTVSAIKDWLIAQAVHTTFSSAAPTWIDI